MYMGRMTCEVGEECVKSVLCEGGSSVGQGGSVCGGGSVTTYADCM